MAMNVPQYADAARAELSTPQVIRAKAPVPARAPQSSAHLLGKNISEIGELLATFQDETDTATAKKADADFRKKVNETLYSPDGGYMYTEGADAAYGLEPTKAGLKEYYDSLMSDLSLGARAKVEAALNIRLSDVEARLNRHGVSQGGAFLDSAGTQRYEAAIVAAENDITEVPAALTLIREELAGIGTRNGWPEETVNEAVRATSEGLHTTVLDKLITSDPGAALEYFDKYGDKFAPEVAEQYETRIFEETARSVITAAPSIKVVLEEARENGVEGPELEIMEKIAAEEMRRREVTREEEAAAATRMVDGFDMRPIARPDIDPKLLDTEHRTKLETENRAAEVVEEVQTFPPNRRVEEILQRQGDLAWSDDAQTVVGLNTNLHVLHAALEDGSLIDNPVGVMGKITKFNPDLIEVEQGREAWANSIATLGVEVFQNPPKNGTEAAVLQRKIEALMDGGGPHILDSGALDYMESRAMERAAGALAEEERGTALRVIEKQGYDIPGLDLTNATAASDTMMARVEAMTDARNRTGIMTGHDIAPSEAVALEEWLANAQVSERTLFFERIGELPISQRKRLAKVFGGTTVAAAFVAAHIDPATVARSLDNPPSPAPVNTTRIADMAGEEAAEEAVNYANAGIVDPESEVLKGLSKAFQDALREGTPPEEVEEELTPGQVRILEEEASKPKTAAEAVTRRLQDDEAAREIAAAHGYVPSTPEAVAEMAGLLDQYDALPEQDRPAFIAFVQEKKRRREIAEAKRPLFHPPGELTRETILDAAMAIRQARDNGTISQEVYNQQGVLIRDLLSALQGEASGNRKRYPKRRRERNEVLRKTYGHDPETGDPLVTLGLNPANVYDMTDPREIADNLGSYYRDDRSIFLNPELSDEEWRATARHEGRHAGIHILDGKADNMDTFHMEELAVLLMDQSLGEADAQRNAAHVKYLVDYVASLRGVEPLEVLREADTMARDLNKQARERVGGGAKYRRGAMWEIMWEMFKGGDDG